MEGTCAASACGKTFGLLVQLVFSLKSTVGFVSNLNHFQLRRCTRPSQKFSLIGLSVRELCGLEVEGVVVGSWNDFHDNASGLLVQLVFCLKSTVGFVSNLNQFQLRRCKRPSQKFSLIGLSVKELRGLEVKGLNYLFFPQTRQVAPSSEA